MEVRDDDISALVRYSRVPICDGARGIYFWLERSDTGTILIGSTMSDNGASTPKQAVETRSCAYSQNHTHLHTHDRD